MKFSGLAITLACLVLVAMPAFADSTLTIDVSDDSVQFTGAGLSSGCSGDPDVGSGYTCNTISGWNFAAAGGLTGNDVTLVLMEPGSTVPAADLSNVSDIIHFRYDGTNTYVTLYSGAAVAASYVSASGIPLGAQFFGEACEEGFCGANDEVFNINLPATGNGVGNNQIILQDVAAVPEPGSLLLLGSGLTGLASYIRRKKLS